MWYATLILAAYYAFKRYQRRRYPGSQLLDVQSVAVTLHCVCLASSLLFLIGFESLTNARFFSFLSTVLSTALTIYSIYGLPKGGAYQLWISTVASGADFPFLMLSLIFIGGHLGYVDSVAVLLLARRSLWFVLTQFSKHSHNDPKLLFISNLWTTLKAAESTVLLIAATAEIMIGFWLSIMIITPNRNIIATIMYWNFLRLRYQSPRSHEIHARSWTAIAEKADPLLKIELVSRIVEKAQKWFKPNH